MAQRELIIDVSQESGQGQEDGPNTRPREFRPLNDVSQAIARNAADQARQSESRDEWDICDNCLNLIASHSTFNRRLGDGTWDVQISAHSDNLRSSRCGFCFNTHGPKSRHTAPFITQRLKQFGDRPTEIYNYATSSNDEVGRLGIEHADDQPMNLFWNTYEIFDAEPHLIRAIPQSPLSFAASRGEAEYDTYQKPPNVCDITGSGLNIARTWLEHCSGNHDDCRMTIEGLQRPQYLVHVTGSTVGGGTEDLVLVETDNLPPVDYAALSYCWGTTDVGHITTTANYNVRLSGFKSSDMPPTIRDAIFVDSPTQKHGEISKMASIFLGAYVTIVAALARSVYDGFLRNQRRPEKSSPVRQFMTGPEHPSKKWRWQIDLPEDAQQSFRVPYWDEHGDLGTLELAVKPDFYGYDAVHTRGWTLEEWFLSRRRLVFTRQQIAWLCETCTIFDGGYSAPGISQYNDEKLGFAAQLLQHFEMRTTSNNLSVPTDLMRIIEIFTNRFFHQKEDRLVALNGVMQHLAFKRDKTLLAGCYVEDMVDFLLWRLRNSGEDFEMMQSRLMYLRSGREESEVKMAYGDDPIEAMAEAYKATIEFDTLGLDYERDKFDQVPTWSWISAKNGWIHFEGRKAKSKTNWIRRIGIVAGPSQPYLEIEGFVVAKWSRPPPLTSGCSSLCGYCPTCSVAEDLLSKKSGQRIFFDHSKERIPSVLHLLPFQRNLETHWISGLIIAKHHKFEAFIRVGFFEIISDVFLEYQHEESQVTLI